MFRMRCGMVAAMPWHRRHGSLHRHLRQVVPQWHVLEKLLLWNSLLYFELSVLHAADVAVDDADVVFLADDLAALRMRERILHLHALKRLDHAFDVLAPLVAGRLDRLLDCKQVLPGLPAMALVHHPLAADFAGVDL